MEKHAEKTSSLGDILIIIAGLFWGSMGIFVRHLNSLGFTSIQVACVRLVTAGIIFSLILLIKDPKGFKINAKDIPLFLALGTSLHREGAPSAWPPAAPEDARTIRPCW